MKKASDAIAVGDSMAKPRFSLIILTIAIVVPT
jgi:hypothetical protein